MPTTVNSFAVWQWPENVPRSEGWSEDANFLIVADWQEKLLIARLLCSPFPNAKCAMCRSFAEMVALTDIIRPSVLITMSQNLLRTTREPAWEVLNALLADHPALRLVLLFGWVLEDILERMEFRDRLYIGYIPFRPADFFETLKTVLHFHFRDVPPDCNPGGPPTAGHSVFTPAAAWQPLS